MVPILASRLIEAMEWRQGYACFAALSLVFGLIAHQLIFRVLDRRETAKPVSRAIAASGVPSNDDLEGVTLSEAVRGYRYWLVGLVATVVVGTTVGAVIHLASYATDRGLTTGFAAKSAGLLGLGEAIARLCVGLMLDRIFAPFIACGVFFAGAVGFYLLTSDILQYQWLLPFGAFVLGVAHGAEGDLIPFLARKYFGVRRLGSIYGSLVSFALVGAASGSYVFGWSFDLAKSYVPILQISAVCLCLCGLAILALGPYRYSSSGSK